MAVHARESVFAATARGTVASLNVSESKGTCKTPVSEVQVTELGFAGDAHAGGWGRQVSLLSLESVGRFGGIVGKEYKPGNFAENITTMGLALENTALLDRFCAADVELEVTQLGKKCHGKGCAIFQGAGKCLMPTEGIFARVRKGGTLRGGDEILHHPKRLRVRVITLSDRASRGVYEDRSGPRIVELLGSLFGGKPWEMDTDTRLLPDDPRLLDEELRGACLDGLDAVFTTGGTGIGPRDWTPDVVTAMADKTIPGIMEAVRMKYGAENPAALLSRSVAAVAGATLIYTLPGSVRAVEEYLGEIAKTFNHLLLTVHGIDSH